MNVNITAQTLFKCFDYETDDPEAVSTRGSIVMQRLIIEVPDNDDPAKCYIASIVPTTGTVTNNKTIEHKLQIGGSMADFSGSVIYNNLAGELARVEKYESGKVVNTADVSECSNQDRFASDVKTIIGRFMVGRSNARPASKNNPFEDETPYFGRPMTNFELTTLFNGITNRQGTIRLPTYGGGETYGATISTGGSLVRINSISIGYIQTVGYQVSGIPNPRNGSPVTTGSGPAVMYNFPSEDGSFLHGMAITILDSERAKLPAGHPLK